MRRSSKSPKRHHRSGGSQAGVAFIETAIAFATFSVLIAGLVSLILQFRFESLTYEALRQSTLEMIQWKPPRNIRSPQVVAAIQCREFGDIISGKLRNVGIDPETVSIELRSNTPNPQQARTLQQVRVKALDNQASRLLSIKPITLNYQPTVNVGVVRCSQRGSSALNLNNGE